MKKLESRNAFRYRNQRKIEINGLAADLKQTLIVDIATDKWPYHVERDLLLRGGREAVQKHRRERWYLGREIQPLVRRLAGQHRVAERHMR